MIQTIFKLPPHVLKKHPSGELGDQLTKYLASNFSEAELTETRGLWPWRTNARLTIYSETKAQANNALDALKRFIKEA